jgi:UDP-N-acetylglucosamine 2-epimerase (non-hydrolysing)
MRGAHVNALVVVGTRPNFVKAAPLVRALQGRGHAVTLVHTGQHYDAALSQVFFDELKLPAPDHYLGVGSGSHAEQTAKVMLALDPLLADGDFDLVIVLGDVNSTAAAALVASKRRVPLAHVEAGLRSFDREMPEELNRLVTDQLADLLFTPSRDGDENLAREGIPDERVHLVGNIMIDSLRAHLEEARKDPVLDELQLAAGGYGVVTLHRPSNVDHPETLAGLLGALREIAADLPLVFPVHPRTEARLAALGPGATDGLRVIPPLGYLAFLRLVADSKLVVTDSGGVQEETTWLGVPCVTARENTERPITVDEGTNTLVGTDPEALLAAARAALAAPPAGRTPELWDGETAGRIVDVIEAWAAAR